MSIKVLKGGLWRGMGGVKGFRTGATAPPGPPAATPSLWYGANWEIAASVLTETRTYRARISNTSGRTLLGVSPFTAAMHAVPGTIIGFRARNWASGGWTNGSYNGSASYTPPPGAWSQYDSPAKLADRTNFAVPVPNGGSYELEFVLAAGSHAVGKVTTNALPTTCLTSQRSDAGKNTIAGDTVTTWSSGFGQPWTHLLLYTDPAQGGIRKEGVGGDSLTANVNPVADSPNTRREGYSIVATATAVTNGDAFQVVSFGRGTYTPAQMAQCHVHLAAALGPEHLDNMDSQGISFNDTPSSQASLDATIAATQSVINLWEAKGVRTGVIFMGPPGSRNTATYLPWWNAAIAYWEAQKPGRVINLAPSVRDPIDTTDFYAPYSQDRVHVNIAGHPFHGASAYAQFKARLQARGELA